MRELAAYGMPRGRRPRRGLLAGPGVARLDGRLDEGSAADFVVYDRNPLDDLSVLAEPKRIVLRGNVVG